MKSIKLWVTIGVLAIIGVGAAWGFMGSSKGDKILNQTVLSKPAANNSAEYNTSPANNDKITKNMPITNKTITTVDGAVIPAGTYYVPIQTASGKTVTDYLVTGMITQSVPVKTYTELGGTKFAGNLEPGTNTLVTGYADGYYVLGTGFGMPTYVKATDVKLMKYSELQSIDLGNSPYSLDFVKNPSYNQAVVDLYEYPTNASKVVGQINTSDLNSNMSQNEATVINTCNKMSDIVYKGQQGWMLTKAHIERRYVNS